VQIAETMRAAIPSGKHQQPQVTSVISISTLFLLDPTYRSRSAIRAAESLGAKPGPLGVGLSICDIYGSVDCMVVHREKSSGVDALLDSFSFFSPRDRTGMFRGPFRKTNKTLSLLR
jgi:hypothetical protein